MRNNYNEKEFKVGDRVKISYIFDNCKFNNKVGTITFLKNYNYYPNGDYSVVEKKQQATISYENGEIDLLDISRQNSALVCEIVKVEEE